MGLGHGSLCLVFVGALGQCQQFMNLIQYLVVFRTYRESVFAFFHPDLYVTRSRWINSLFLANPLECLSVGKFFADSQNFFHVLVRHFMVKNLLDVFPSIRLDQMDADGETPVTTAFPPAQ